jgi:hypothetical protein
MYLGKRHCFSLGHVERLEAEAKTNQADYLLMRIRQGLLKVPLGMDIVTFLEFDGKPPEAVPAAHLLRPGRECPHRGRAARWRSAGCTSRTAISARLIAPTCCLP